MQLFLNVDKNSTVDLSVRIKYEYFVIFQLFIVAQHVFKLRGEFGVCLI